MVDILYKSENSQAIIIKALYESGIELALKFGYLNSIKKEYMMQNELSNFPNFIKYFCLIVCDDNIKNIISNQTNIPNYKICESGEDSIGNTCYEIL